MSQSFERPPAPASPLGLGCAGLLRLPKHADQIALLEAAYDAGVRHFDVARMYGLGKAEGVLGAFAASHRQDITITTKFGIQVSENLAKASNVQTAARWVLRQVPALRKLVKGRLGGSTTRDFSFDGAKVSVETSLRELGTETIDYLLLHEPQGLEGIDPALEEYLESLKSQGTIRAYGTSADAPVLEAFVNERPRLTATAMVPVPAPKTLLGDPTRRLFTFGHLGDRDRVAANLKGHAEKVKALDLDPADPDAAGLLILRRAVLRNPEGGTIFFTSSPARLRKTAGYVLRPAEEGELQRLDEVVGA